MGLETGTYVSDLNTSNPTSTDVRSQGDDHLRLLKSVLQATFPNASKPFRFSTGSAKSADYIILSTDLNKFISMDASGGARSFTLPTLTAGDDGWEIVLNKIDSSANAVTIVGTVNGAANPTLGSQWQSATVWWSGSSWYMSKSVLASNIDYTSLTGLTAPAVDDVLPIYDLSATSNKKIALSDLVAVINVLTTNSSPAVDDVLATYDTSAGAARGMSFANFAKLINVLPEDTSPLKASDYLMTYDASAGAAKKALLSNFDLSGWIFLKGYDASASGNIDFNSVTGDPGFDTTYDEYVIVISSLKVSSDGHIQIRIATGGAPTWQTAANYEWQAYGRQNNAQSNTGGTSSTSMRLGDVDSSSLVNRYMSARIYYGAPSSGDFVPFDWQFRYLSSGPSFCQGAGGGFYKTAGAITGIRFFPEVGNFPSGSFRLYGLRKT